MENQTKGAISVPEDDKQRAEEAVSRRRLLKTVAAAGGAVAAWTFLPEKWTTPVVEAGELSAHAAASPVSGSIRIEELFLWDEGDDLFRAEVHYHDPAGIVTEDTARLSAFVSPCGDIIFPDTFVKDIPGGFVSPWLPPPTVGFPFTHNITSTCPSFCVDLRASSAVSNQKCGTLPD